MFTAELAPMFESADGQLDLGSDVQGFANP